MKFTNNSSEYIRIKQDTNRRYIEMINNRVTMGLIVMKMIGAVHRRARVEVAHQARLIDHRIRNLKGIPDQVEAEAPLKRQVNTSAPSRLQNISLRNN